MTSPAFLIMIFLTLINGAPVTVDKAKEYLETYGYLQPPLLRSVSGEEREDPQTELRQAIEKFQMMAGIEVSGELDRATREKMADPRCGVPDIASLTSDDMKWMKQDLTYSIDNLNSGMQMPVTRSSIRNAFDKYSDVIPLTFGQVNPGQGDFNVLFASRAHDDGLANYPFDGPGGVLAHAFFPENGKVHFDADEKWWRMDKYNVQEAISSGYTDFYTVAIHEIGHSLGLSHSSTSGSIMAPYYIPPTDDNGNYVEPQLDRATIVELQRLYGSDTPEGTGELIEHKSNTDCTQHVYAVMSLPKHRIVLFASNGTQLIVFDSRSRQFIQKVSVSEIFAGGPLKVTAAYYNDTNRRVMLFSGNKVWGYDYSRTQNTMKISKGYPKRLPVDSNWKTTAAMSLPSRGVIVSDRKYVAYYDEERNKMEVMGHISRVYPKMNEDIVGFAESNLASYVGFTDSDVFSYDFNKHSTKYLGSIKEQFRCEVRPFT